MNALEMTIEQITYEHYFPAKRRRGRATDTLDGYASSARLYVIPMWGDRPITGITRDEVQDWVDELAQRPETGPGGAWKAYKTLRQVVRWAMAKWSLFVADPTLGIEEPRRKTYRPETLTERRLKRLIRGMVGCQVEAAVVVSSSLGTRPSETYAVRWERISWRTGEVPIDTALITASDGTLERPTKTVKGERSGYLPPWALDRLHQIWVGLGRPKGRIIGELKPSQVAYRVKTWIKRHRLPRISMKNLRHTWGTIAAKSGVKIETVAAMMGHSNIQVTYRYYYSLDAATSKTAQRRVARRILGKTCDDMYRGIPLAPAPVELPLAA